jgi:hypothetical protein
MHDKLPLRLRDTWPEINVHVLIFIEENALLKKIIKVKKEYVLLLFCFS